MPDAFRVLLVDDSETVTGMLSMILGSAGYAIETAGDGVKGVRAAFRRVPPDLVVMSARMPRLDGIQGGFLGSVGVASFLPGTEGTETTVIGSADQALYSAKRGGRNRVVCSPAKDA